MLATGVTVPRRLGIDGEENVRCILHSSGQLDRHIPDLQACGGHRKRNAIATTTTTSERRPTMDPVLVIGDGLNAADAVIKCLINGVPVAHSFRKTPKDSRQILSKLSNVLYPEYHTVYQLMTGAAVDPLYRVYPRTQIQRFEYDEGTNENGAAILRNMKTGAIEKIRFNRAAVLIGFEADLSFMEIDRRDDSSRDRRRSVVDSKSNTLNVDPNTCRCRDEEDLYAIGPLIGDNFVRYLIGGSLAAAADIIRRKRE